MPKSRSKRVRYQPPPKKRPSPSPRWFGALILGLFLVGVAVIVLNYMELLPGTVLGAKNSYLWTGLGLIAVGFMLATRWR
jgi:hypothetical protein